MKLHIYTDGGARGNPGPGAIGISIKTPEGKVVREVGKYIGNSTNNEAEYLAITGGLILAKKLGGTHLECFLDSQLVVKQLCGEYRVKNERMRKHFDRVKNLEKDFEEVVYTYIPRQQNKRADALVNQALDKQMSETN